MMSKTSTRQDRATQPAQPKPNVLASTVLVWLALLSLVVGWLCITPIYSPPHWSAVIFFILAAAFLTVFFRQIDVSPVPWMYLIVLLPLGFSAFLIPWPYNMGSLFLSASLVLIGLGLRSHMLRRVALALGVSGLVMLLLSAVQPVFFKIFANYHGASWDARAVQLILNSIGARVSIDGSVLHLQTFEGLKPINVTWEALGFYAVANLAIAGMALLFILRVGWARWMAFIAILALYPIIRYPVLLLIYEETDRTDLWWASWVTILTLVPLSLLLGRFVTRDLHTPEHLDWPQLDLGRGALRLILASTIVAVCVVGLFCFQDPGIRKPGRVLIDEAHSNWERTTRKYDTKWYSQASGYNYFCMADYLGHFYRVDRANMRITPDLLSLYDILILKTLTKPLQPDEIDAITDFVRTGGGLWLVGDHTNVFGISAHVNPLAQRFGMYYKYDATYDLTNGGLSIYRPSTMLPHPTIQHMPQVFLFGTSCSMSASLWSDYPIIGYSLRSLRADYAQENFFPENKPTLDQEFGLFPQQVAIRYGHGRVVAFTDSTVFSNFWFYMPGKSELCLGTINWLDHSNRWGFVRWLLGVLALGVLWLSVRWLSHMNPMAAIIYMLVGALLGVPVGVRAFAAMNRAAYPLPIPHTPLPRIAFERRHCNYTLPSEALNSSMALENHYHTFFVWTQRLGYMPASIGSLEDSLANTRLLVLLNPNKSFSARELSSMKRYLQQGGRILVLDGTHNAESTANQLLEEYGISIGTSSLPQSFIFDHTGKRIAAIELPRPVQGGKPVLTMAFGKPFVTTTQVGKGIIAVMGSSHLFTDRTMGVTSTVPNAYQSGVYELEFWLFQNLMQGPSDPNLWSLPKPMANPPEEVNS